MIQKVLKYFAKKERRNFSLRKFITFWSYILRTYIHSQREEEEEELTENDDARARSWRFRLRPAG